MPCEPLTPLLPHSCDKEVSKIEKCVTPHSGWLLIPSGVYVNRRELSDSTTATVSNKAYTSLCPTTAGFMLAMRSVHPEIYPKNKTMWWGCMTLIFFIKQVIHRLFVYDVNKPVDPHVVVCSRVSSWTKRVSMNVLFDKFRDLIYSTKCSNVKTFRSRDKHTYREAILYITEMIVDTQMKMFFF